MTVSAADIAAMSKTLDKLYAETDLEFRELRPSDSEWAWAHQNLKAFTDRITEIEWGLSFDVGREAFTETLIKWQKNIRHVLKQIKKHRTDPFGR